MTTDGGANEAGAGGNAGAGPDLSNYVFPLTFTPLTTAATSTADISLYFSVTDQKGLGVSGLATTNKTADSKDPFSWVYSEDGVAVDPLESGFSVTQQHGDTLDMPTVLVLDLSGSIVSSGALSKLQAAADALVDSMLPEQRMAVMTFADKGTVRVPFSTDKSALKKVIDGLDTSDGVSTNLYGAMTQAFGLWNDGFVSDPKRVKLTAGLAIVLTDGQDDAGVKTLADVITARGNKRVVSVGIGNNVNISAMTQMATTGTFIKVSDFDSLSEQVAIITSTMQTLGESIYTANYCSPKRAGTHNLLFSVVGNGNLSATGCMPATFSSSAPSACAMLDPDYTQACGAIGAGSTDSSISCCPANAPYACPKDTHCYPTAEKAAAACGTATETGCILCGGTGYGKLDDQLTPGSAIRVRFTAEGYATGQCEKFWGPNCKGLGDCCATVPDSQVSSCQSALTSAQGMETTCSGATKLYCPELGENCSALKDCCDGLATNAFKQQCLTALFSAQAAEASCSQLTPEYCPTTTACQALSVCCGTFLSSDASSPGRSTDLGCLSSLVSAADDMTLCQNAANRYCPTSSNCTLLRDCCTAKLGSDRMTCEQNLVSANGNDASCQTLLTTLSCP